MIFFLTCLIIVEILLWFLIFFLKKDFPWLITKKDLSIEIDSEVAEKFFHNSFHPKLGWLRKKNSSFADLTEHGKVYYSISDDGTRENFSYDPNNAPITSYGDSFCFGRLVGNKNTWQYHLSNKLQKNVSNRGVGNYGLDQALMRFELEVETLSCQHLIINVVPETIARVLSTWKHYFEYGNTLAFKPKFKFSNGKLEYINSPINDIDSLIKKAKSPDEEIKSDYFFKRKFFRDIIRFPILICLFKKPKRHLSLIFYRILDVILACRGKERRNLAFKVILKENKSWTRKLFNKKEPVELLLAIFNRFYQVASKNNIQITLLWTPQIIDLDQEFILTYKDFLRKLSSIPITIVDMTDEFLEYKREAYVNGELGPHPSNFGNKLIAEKLYPYFK